MKAKFTKTKLLYLTIILSPSLIICMDDQPESLYPNLFEESSNTNTSYDFNESGKILNGIGDYLLDKINTQKTKQENQEADPTAKENLPDEPEQLKNFEQDKCSQIPTPTKSIPEKSSKKRKKQNLKKEGLTTYLIVGSIGIGCAILLYKFLDYKHEKQLNSKV